MIMVKKKSMLFIIIGLMTSVILINVSDLEVERIYESPKGVASRTIDQRMSLFELSMLMFKDKPVLGHGPHGFVIEYFPYAYRAPPKLKKSELSDSLNLYTEILVDYRFVGNII